MYKGVCGRIRVKQAASPTRRGVDRVGEAAGSREGFTVQSLLVARRVKRQ